MAGRQQRLPRERLDFSTCGHDPLVRISRELLVGSFRGPTYLEAPGRFQYEPYRGPGHIALRKALDSGTAARCWFTSLGRRVEFGVTHEEFDRGQPETSPGWFVVVSRIGGMTSG
jgi:hypothetical protein